MGNCFERTTEDSKTQYAIPYNSKRDTVSSKPISYIDAKETQSVTKVYNSKKTPSKFDAVTLLKGDEDHQSKSLLDINSLFFSSQCVENGFIIYRSPNGITFKGTIKENQAYGFGIVQFPNGDWFKGNLAQGKPNGFGIYFIEKFNRMITGDWSNGKAHGIIVEKSKQDIYEGQFSNGSKHGLGSYLLEDGTSYNGEFKQGLENGIVI